MQKNPDERMAFFYESAVGSEHTQLDLVWIGNLAEFKLLEARGGYFYDESHPTNFPAVEGLVCLQDPNAGPTVYAVSLNHTVEQFYAFLGYIDSQLSKAVIELDPGSQGLSQNITRTMLLHLLMAPWLVLMQERLLVVNTNASATSNTPRNS